MLLRDSRSLIFQETAGTTLNQAPHIVTVKSLFERNLLWENSPDCRSSE